MGDKTQFATIALAAKYGSSVRSGSRHDDGHIAGGRAHRAAEFGGLGAVAAEVRTPIRGGDVSRARCHGARFSAARLTSNSGHPNSCVRLNDPSRFGRAAHDCGGRRRRIRSQGRGAPAAGGWAPGARLRHRLPIFFRLTSTSGPSAYCWICRCPVSRAPMCCARSTGRERTFRPSSSPRTTHPARAKSASAWARLRISASRSTSACCSPHCRLRSVRRTDYRGLWSHRRRPARPLFF